MAIRQVIVIDGDTIHRVARRETGITDRWWTIALFNELDYPYIDTTLSAKTRDQTGKKILIIGDTILIPDPSPNQQVNDRQAAQPIDDHYVRLFGIDVELDRDGDLVIDDAKTSEWVDGEELHVQGDLRTVRGIDNLTGALLRRLEIFRGELVYHPSYGSNIHNLPGGVADMRLLALAKIESVQTMGQDPRIESVTNIRLAHDADRFDLQADFTAIGQRDSDALTADFRVNRR